MEADGLKIQPDPAASQRSAARPIVVGAALASAHTTTTRYGDRHLPPPPRTADLTHTFSLLCLSKRTWTAPTRTARRTNAIIAVRAGVVAAIDGRCPDVVCVCPVLPACVWVMMCERPNVSYGRDDARAAPTRHTSIAPAKGLGSSGQAQFDQDQTNPCQSRALGDRAHALVGFKLALMVQDRRRSGHRQNEFKLFSED